MDRIGTSEIDFLKDDITYELEYHTGPDQNGQGNSYIHQTTINRILNGVKSPSKHPE